MIPMRPPRDVPRGMPLCNYLHVYKNDQMQTWKLLQKRQTTFHILTGYRQKLAHNKDCRKGTVPRESMVDLWMEYKPCLLILYKQGLVLHQQVFLCSPDRSGPKLTGFFYYQGFIKQRSHKLQDDCNVCKYCHTVLTDSTSDKAIILQHWSIHDSE